MKVIDCKTRQTYLAVEAAIREKLKELWNDKITTRYAPEPSRDATVFMMPILSEYEGEILQAISGFEGIELKQIEGDG